jgi:uroporphyrinogen decarboxylase
LVKWDNGRKEMKEMTSLERVFTTLSHKEPDRVPLFLLLTMHGAKELGITIREYFSSAENVAEGQLRLQKKYKHDCYYPFFYAPLEVEAWGGEVIFREDGPANSGMPIIKNPEDILKLTPPEIKDNACLGKMLRSIEILKAKGGEVPIVGVVMAPFSLPVMQMGFDKYFDLMYERTDLFEHLMRVNEEFTVNWANAQLKSGATAITYFDPVSSTTIIPRDFFLKTGFQIAKRTFARINGPTGYHLASGRCLPIIDDIAQLGTALVGTSTMEDIASVKTACKENLTVLGNLNGIEMCRWTSKQAEKTVIEAIQKAGPGGGFILSDNHGEIPFQVPDDILMTIADTVKSFGNYPISVK